MALLAVYGTLKRPYGNHRLIVDAKLPFVGTAITNSSGFMMEGGGFPIVYEGEDEQMGDRIFVELYRFEDEDQITRIDNLEGHPDWYTRKPFEFSIVESEEFLEGQPVQAQMYVMELDHSRKFREARYHETVIRNEETKVATWER